MNKQQAIEIIEREPVLARYYSPMTKLFYLQFGGMWFSFKSMWIRCQKPPSIAIPMHEILEIALGED